MDTTSDTQKANELIHESSPYLLQHAYNPVDWKAWNEGSLQQARESGRLIVISIGYAACHWCHVMEHESFEDSTVAALMNENYISIKVDREERPDVDQVYMDAAQAISGRGGWPLNAIALPDGRPVYAGTYFPKDQWLKLLQYFSEVYRDNPEKLTEQAEAISQGISEMEVVGETKPLDFSEELISDIWKNWQPRLDYRKGGRAGAPKFPMPVNYEYLLRYYQYSGDEEVRDIVRITLDRMADGGIYDQAGGGFARYSVDADWLVPHFEKMLYDNGQLVSLYAKAWRLFREERYEAVVRQTIEFVQRELQHPDGAFYASLDADSEGEEGKFYCWTADEIDGLLGADAAWFKELNDIRPEGNWEHGKNILHRSKPLDEVEGASEEALEKIHAILMKEREGRVRPGLDNKVLTSWNALMINGLTDAYRTFGAPEFLEAALNAAAFLRKHCLHADGRLDRNYADKGEPINGFLEDYALLSQAWLNLYSATFDESWIAEAELMLSYAKTHFHDSERGLYAFTSDLDPALVSRKFEKEDNVIVSANSQMARNLLLLGKLTDRNDLQEESTAMVAHVSDRITQYGQFYSNWGLLVLDIWDEPFEVVFSGPGAHSLRAEFDREFHPNTLVLGTEDNSSLPLVKDKSGLEAATIFVCYRKACQLPVREVAEARKQLNSNQK